jgi:hypothetical protein
VAIEANTEFNLLLDRKKSLPVDTGDGFRG